MKLGIERLASSTLPIGTGWLLGACMEARGKQALWTRQRPELLEHLRRQALVQSTESSNRIEGITVAADRLEPLVLGRARPMDRSEEEVAGYRKALQWIHTRRRPLDLEPQVILHLHSLSQAGLVADAGTWKIRDNEIVEITARGERRVRFRPLAAKATPGAMQHLCQAFQACKEEREIPGLLAAATFILDFLCIHPFRDGNGRVSRLLTTLLLQHDGFQVSRYVSLERLVEESKADYYRILASCSHGWHNRKNDLEPWWNYFLGIPIVAYRQLEDRVASGSGLTPLSELIRQAVLARVGPFSLAELKAEIPGASFPLLKKVLARMKAAGTIQVQGRGRGALWERIVS